MLCKPLAKIIIFYSTSSINLVMNLNKFNILFMTYPLHQKELLTDSYDVIIMISALSIHLEFTVTQMTLK